MGNNKGNSIDTENSYGGCKYRLKYDKYENKNNSGHKVNVKSVIITIIAFIVFAVLGYVIIKSYSSSVSKIYDDESQTVAEVDAVFPSLLNK